MDTILKLKDSEIAINGVFRGFKQSTWGVDHHYHHLITLTYEGVSISFDYWIPALNTVDDLESAFKDFLADAFVGVLTYEEFCSKFDHDPDKESSKRAHLHGIMTFDLYKTLGLNEVLDLTFMIHEL